MPLRSAQLLIRTASLDALADSIERALRRQKPLAPGAARRLLAVQCGDWCALLDDTVDGGLARLLSESVEGPVLAVELDSSALSLRLRRFVAGEPGPSLQEPPEPQNGELPCFRDVEQLAWDELRMLGVPVGLRLCAPESVELLEADDESGFPAILLEATAAGVTRTAERALTQGQAEGNAPPVRPDSLVESAAGESRALEVRTLPPLRPNPAAAGSLVAIEEAQALRLCAQLGRETDEERVPRPAFAYRIEQAEELQPLLEAARAARPRLVRLLDAEQPTPLSVPGFSAHCRRALATALPEARVLRAHGLWLEVAQPGAEGCSLKLALAPTYTAYLDGGGEGEDAAAARVTEAAQALLAIPAVAAPTTPPALEWDRETLLSGLLPTLIPAPVATGRASALYVGSLSAALLCDDGRRIAPVSEAALQAVGLDFDEALARALENADALTLRSPQGILWFDLDHGRVAVTDFDDPAGAGRLLSPMVRGLLLQILGGECWAAAPTRDTVVACAPHDEEAVRWLREEAQRRHQEGPFPLDPMLLDVADEGLTEVDDPFRALGL